MAVEEALAKTATTDRVILEDLRPVPKPVKMATLQVLMHERLQAYILQLGVHWKVGGWQQWWWYSAQDGRVGDGA